MAGQVPVGDGLSETWMWGLCAGASRPSKPRKELLYQRSPPAAAGPAGPDLHLEGPEGTLLGSNPSTPQWLFAPVCVCVCELTVPKTGCTCGLVNTGLVSAVLDLDLDLNLLPSEKQNVEKKRLAGGFQSALLEKSAKRTFTNDSVLFILLQTFP